MPDRHRTEPGRLDRHLVTTRADRLTSSLLACILLGFAIFAIWPEIDLRLSQAFHDRATGFAIDGHPATEALRLAVWTLAILLCLAAALGMALGAARREVLLPTRAWGFVLTLYILGPGVMVEMLTKPLWGRARPAQVAEFGGTLHFSPANELAGACTRNCSFVSGEVSGATVTALVLLLIRPYLQPRLPKPAAALLVIAACCLPPAIALQRIAAGRHFLSDTVFAVLFTLLLALGLSVLLRGLPDPMRRVQARLGTVPTDR